MASLRRSAALRRKQAAKKVAELKATTQNARKTVMKQMDNAGKAARKAVNNAQKNGTMKKVAAVAAVVVAGAVATGAMIRRA